MHIRTRVFRARVFRAGVFRARLRDPFKFNLLKRRKAWWFVSGPCQLVKRGEKRLYRPKRIVKLEEALKPIKQKHYRLSFKFTIILCLFLWRNLLMSSVRLLNMMLGSTLRMSTFRPSIPGIVWLFASMALRGKQCSV